MDRHGDHRRVLPLDVYVLLDTLALWHEFRACHNPQLKLLEVVLAIMAPWLSLEDGVQSLDGIVLLS